MYRRGDYQLEPIDGADVSAAVDLVRRYQSMDLGLADASIVLLADHFGASDVLTLDERHFRTVRRAGGRAFRLLPADLESSES